VVGGERVGADDQNLHAALKRHRGDGKPVVIDARPGARFSLLLKVVQATRGKLDLQVGSAHRELMSSPKKDQKDDNLLTLGLSTGRAVLRFSAAGSQSTQQFEWTPGKEESNQGAIAWLAGVCGDSENVCDHVFVEGDADVTVEHMVETLSAFDALRDGKKARVVGLGRFDRAKNAEKLPTTRITGRLPPGHVRQVVRDHFGDFRSCYERGLARNPDLRGKVMARFVIGRTGKVENVSDAGSDMPDAKVTACVLEAFYGLRFDAPDSGIVIVVYPIMLSAD
jgi:hypothetical protein